MTDQHFLTAAAQAIGPRPASARQVAVLLARGSFGRVADDPYAATGLLGALRKAGAGEQVAALANRVAAHAALDNRRAVAKLLGALRKAGAGEQVRTLVDRMSAEGRFDLFCEQANHQKRYLWGREPDRSPARP